MITKEDLVRQHAAKAAAEKKLQNALRSAEQVHEYALWVQEMQNQERRIRQIAIGINNGEWSEHADLIHIFRPRKLRTIKRASLRLATERLSWFTSDKRIIVCGPQWWSGALDQRESNVGSGRAQFVEDAFRPPRKASLADIAINLGYMRAFSEQLWGITALL